MICRRVVCREEPKIVEVDDDAAVGAAAPEPMAVSQNDSGDEVGTDRLRRLCSLARARLFSGRVANQGQLCAGAAQCHVALPRACRS